MNYSTNPPLLLAADWLIDGLGGGEAEAALIIEEGLIKKILTGKESRDKFLASDQGSRYRFINYESAVLSPGLINLHTHLDYTAAADLYEQYENDQEKQRSQNKLFQWLYKLVSKSRQWSAEDFRQSAASGAEKLLAAGVTFCVDSSYTGEAARALAEAGLKGLVGLELFGLDENRAAINFERWCQRWAALKQDPLLSAAQNRVTLTVAPHAPYTVAPSLWQKADAFAEKNSLPVLAHLAESSQECLWLKAGDKEVDDYIKWVSPPGSREDLLESLSFRGKGRTPVEHLKEHQVLNSRLIAAHCLKFSQTDLDLFAESGARAALCPRSNAALGNGCPDLKRFFDLPAGLGTDSLASSPDLSPRLEAAWLTKNYDSRSLHCLITEKAAKAAGMRDLGAIEVGRRADLAIFRLAEPQKVRSLDEAYDAFFASKTETEAVFVDGGQIWAKNS
ncbi:MAG: amidohydrolase family protein [Candidatus Obscuribacterales bacterium]|nr:amidohydrolase family protein [Candidatus Obscuribacterales bacterium]